MKISFDYDMTLGEPFIQEIAKMFIKCNADVWVLTSRTSDRVYDDGKLIGFRGWNTDLRIVTKKLGIPEDKIIYTEGAFKWKAFFHNKFDLHFDDMYNEVENIHRRGGKALLVGYDMFDQASELFAVDDLNTLLK
jgi:hypothetical protein